MNTLKKRLLSAFCMVAFSVCFAVAQTNTIKHTVDRGETLTSIAKRYATTEAKIIELNPDAAQFVYVGMELIIPVTSPNYNDETIIVSKNSPDANSDNELYQLGDNSLKRTYEYKVFAGGSMNNFICKDAKNMDMIYGFHAGFSAIYNFYENIFLEGSIGIATKGYKSNGSITSGYHWDDEGANYDNSTSTKYMSYNVELPILIGYSFFVNDVLNLKIKVGPYLTYVISGKEKKESYTTIYPDIHSSETEHAYKETKVGDIKGFKNFGYGIHASIGVDYKYLALSASYQRGFSKVFNDKKIYEQNILLSIGYRF